MELTLRHLEQAVDGAVDRVARIRARNALSSRLSWTGQSRQALPIAQAAAAELLPDDQSQLVAETRHALARCHFYLYDLMSSLELLLEAARAYADANDRRGQATALAGVGTCQLRLGAPDEAITTLLRALERARAIRFPTLEINVLNSLASTMLAGDHLDDAEKYLDAGIALARAGGDRNLLTKLLLNRSLVEKKRVQARGSDVVATHGIGYVEEALALARELANRYDEAFCLGQLGAMLRLANRPADAGAALKASLALAIELDESHLHAEALLELGRLAGAAGDLEAAMTHTEAAWPLAEHTRERELQGEILSALSAVHEQRGELAAAFAVYKRFHALREHELEVSRRQAAKASQLWLDYERAEAEAAACRAAARAAVEESQRDPLTGLLNRRGLDAGIAALMTPPATAFAVVLIDVDRFKLINDRHSHAVGDAVLARLAAILRDHARSADLAVRLGGDEFALVLANAGHAEAAHVAARIDAAVRALAWTDLSTPLAVTVSVGVAAREAEDHFATTLATADRALYVAKAGGPMAAMARA